MEIKEIIKQDEKMNFLDIKKVCQKTSLARSTIYKLIHMGKFPKPIKLFGTNRVAWLESWIDDWMLNLMSNA